MRFKDFVRRNEHLFKYIFIGGSCASLDLIIFTSIIYLGFNYQIANVIGYFLGTLCSFLLNRNLNFKVKDKTTKRLFMFLFVGLIGYFSSAISLYILISILNSTEIVAKIASLFIVVLVQFTLNKKLTFGI